jgi:hypothetical protein
MARSLADQVEIKESQAEKQPAQDQQDAESGKYTQRTIHRISSHNCSTRIRQVIRDSLHQPGRASLRVCPDRYIFYRHPAGACLDQRFERVGILVQDECA